MITLNELRVLLSFALHSQNVAINLAFSEMTGNDFDAIIDALVDHGLLSGKNKTTVTEKGHAYIEALLAVPLPVQRWMVPK